MGAGRPNDPIPLKILKGRGFDRDGNPVDQEGKPIPTAPAFRRVAPEKPDGLDEYGSALWDRVVDELARIGMIKELDGAALEVGCHTYSRWKKAVMYRRELEIDPECKGHGLIAETSQGYGVAPWVRVESDAEKQFRAWCNEFGMTPAAEVKVARIENDPPAGAGQGSAFG